MKTPEYGTPEYNALLGKILDGLELTVKEEAPMKTPVKNAVLHNNVTQEDEIIDVINEGANQYGFNQGHIVTPQGIVHVWQARNGTWYVSSGYAMSENGVTRYWNGKTK